MRVPAAIALALLVVGCAQHPATPTKAEPTILLQLQPLGNVEQSAIDQVRKTLSATFRFRVEVEEEQPLPRSAWYAPRSRWLATAILSQPRASKTFYITSQDISLPLRGKQNWGVLGCTSTNAIVSTFRLHRNLQLLHDVTIHEMGHLLGLPHCKNKHCVMQDFEGHVATIGDAHDFCPDCKAKMKTFLN